MPALDRHTLPLLLLASLAAGGVWWAPASAHAAWPPTPGANLQDPANWPNDPGYAGSWNLWSFVPNPTPGKQNWWATPGFRKAELKLGTGMHADRGWTYTPGDRRVVIAVLDSGIKWDADDLVNKHFLNRAELPKPDAKCHGPKFNPADPYDSNGDGVFNMADWAVEQNRTQVPKTACDPKVSDKNGNGLLDPGDLIALFSDGKDDDNNGYPDDISGWDFFRNDNDPYDDTRYGHGTGEARDSGAEGNNGRGDIGVCPECTILMVRVADSFLADGNDFAAATLFAVDSGASVIQEALGTMNRGHYADAAIDYAYRNNAVVIASAADELSFHHNMPGTTDHTVVVHAIVFDQGSPENSTTFLNFNNCTNYGGNLVLSSPGTGCSSEATGVTSGHAGMIYSAALAANAGKGLAPPLSAEEVRGVLVQSADDIDVPESHTDTTKFPSGPGWDLHFGYGRNNVGNSVEMVLAGAIPPEADILLPSWFEPIEVTRTPKVAIVGRIGKRTDGLPARYASYAWKLEAAKGIDPKSGWSVFAQGTTPGLEGAIAEWDAAKAAESIDFTVPLVDHDQYSFTLKLTVTAQTADGKLVQSEFRKSVGLYKDPDLLPGFPLKTKASIEASPKLFDLDGDGKDELIQPQSDGSVHAYRADGKDIAGWPVWAPIRAELSAEPSAGKGYAKNACAYRKDKTGCKRQVGTLSPEHRSMVLGTPAVGDLDHDGKVEVVLTTYDGHVFAVHADGTPVKGFPVAVDRQLSQKTDEEHLWDDGLFAAVALADLDKDGKLEVVAPAMDQRVYVWRHDGSPQPGFPVWVRDPEAGDSKGDRIITSAAIGDVDGDGTLDIATGTNEVFGSGTAKNEARGYVLHGNGNLHLGADGKPAPFLAGFPIVTYGLTAYVLPTVGSGVPGNPALVDLDHDGALEVNFDTVGSAGTFYTYKNGGPLSYCIGKKAGKCKGGTFDQSAFGKGASSKDSPAYILISNASLGKVDPTGGVDFVKATAGFSFAKTFASGGLRADFDHQTSAWDSETGKQLEGWPRKMDDWQFFSNPAIVDLDNDTNAEVVAGSAGYLLHAWNYKGVEPKGWPKYTMGWILASAAVGDIDGDGQFDAAVGTRDGWLFAWKTAGKKTGSVKEWPMHGHDLHNSNNYHAAIDPYHTAPTTPAGGADAGSSGDVGDVTQTTAPASTPRKSDNAGCTAGAPYASVWGLWVAVAMAIGSRRRRA